MTNEERTVWSYDDEPEKAVSGTACEECGTTYEACTRTLLSKRAKVCCRRCQYTDTHDTKDVKSSLGEKNFSLNLTSLPMDGYIKDVQERVSQAMREIDKMGDDAIISMLSARGITVATPEHDRLQRIIGATQALESAAQDIGPEVGPAGSGHTSTYSVRKWLRARISNLNKEFSDE